ncbi:hypothetical protein N7486_004021 [Penicillium sp. IBT 16267x]|nr:hypothetical protein N7486_004021 [Penicillium sp. IBT 16267x]
MRPASMAYAPTTIFSVSDISFNEEFPSETTSTELDDAGHTKELCTSDTETATSPASSAQGDINTNGEKCQG